MLKTFTVVISLFMLANTPFRETILELERADIAAYSFESQPLAQYASALCSIPVKIMNSLLDGTPLSPSKSGHPKKSESRKDASSDYSLLVKSPSAEKQLTVTYLGASVTAMRFAPDALLVKAESAHHPPGPPIELIMFLLMLFVILPRSGISEAAVFLRLNR